MVAMSGVVGRSRSTGIKRGWDSSVSWRPGPKKENIRSNAIVRVTLRVLSDGGLRFKLVEETGTPVEFIVKNITLLESSVTKSNIQKRKLVGRKNPTFPLMRHWVLSHIWLHSGISFDTFRGQSRIGFNNMYGWLTMFKTWHTLGCWVHRVVLVDR